MLEVVKSSQQLIKESNMRLVFRLIHKNGCISRADIKKITGLSATTVSSLVEELMADGLVEECGIKDSNTSGRKAVLLQVRADGGYFVGLDIRKNHIVADVFALDFTSVFHTEVPIVKGHKIAMGILHAIGMASRNRRILGVTMGVPGVIDTKNNRLLSSTVLEAEDAQDVYQTVSEAMPDVRVILKNNSGLVAYAEKEFGADEQVKNLVSIDIDDGVGAGILIDGNIYDGSGMAGEFGHISVDFNGKRCKCGNYGCLELVASIPAILRKTECFSMDELLKKLEDNNKKAKEAVLDTARALAFGVNNIVNLIDPEFIVIGGPIRTLGEFLMEPLKRCFDEISLIKDKYIRYSVLQGNPVTLGGAKVVFDLIFGA
ncbi:MAG: ROK family transcriptional regulator [Clostridia bacterium]|nr:ROK family transcriptional regulator [Clostridia bacterium]